LESPLTVKFTEPVSCGKSRKNISYECEWAFHCQFFVKEALCVLISHIFWLELLKPGFCNLKSKFSLNLEMKYQWFNVK
jgi:hypothetical protein